MLSLARPRPATLATSLSGLTALRRALAWRRRLLVQSLGQGWGLPSPHRALNYWEQVASLGERAEFSPEVRKLEFLRLRSEAAGNRGGPILTPVLARRDFGVAVLRHRPACMSSPDLSFKSVESSLAAVGEFFGRGQESRAANSAPEVAGSLPAVRSLEFGAPFFGSVRRPILSVGAGLLFQSSLPTMDSRPWARTPKELLLTHNLVFRPGWHPTSKEAAASIGYRQMLEGDGEENNQAGSWAWWAARSEAAPLGISPRLFLEKFLPEMDLTQVRLHTDASADAAARILGAEAFAIGQDIFFQAGRFNLATARGMALLGHELVHARQMADNSPYHRSVRGEMLELQARRLEAHLLQPLPLVAADQVGQDSAPVFPALRAYTPFNMEMSRSAGPQAGADRAGLTGEGGHTLSREGPAMGGVAGPLRAEPGRDLSSPAGSTGASTAPGATGEPGALSREIFRSLNRKIRIDKERRGVDRWEL